jgi:hypothetical protein
VRADAIGQLMVTVPPGRHVVEIEHGVHGDLIAGTIVAALAAIAFVAVAARRRSGGRA